MQRHHELLEMIFSIEKIAFFLLKKNKPKAKKQKRRDYLLFDARMALWVTIYVLLST